MSEIANSLIIFLEKTRNLFRKGQGRKRYSYRSRSSLDNLMNQDYIEQTVWDSDPQEEDTHLNESSTLYQIWKNIEGGHKWLHYFPIYEKLFSSLADKPLRILEIGVYNGGSIKMWTKYFRNYSLFVGLDIDPRCAEHTCPDKNIHVIIGSQDDEDLLEKTGKDFGPFDIIIDDGSHINSHMIKTFNSLFSRHLKEGGLYVVEDVHTSYWKSYRDIPRSFLDYAMRCSELMGIHYASTPFKDYDFSSKKPIRTPALAKLIEEIRFFDSIIVFERASAKRSPTVRHL